MSDIVFNTSWAISCFLLTEIQNYSTKQPLDIFRYSQKPNLPCCVNTIGDTPANRSANLLSLAIGVWLFTSFLFVLVVLQ